MSNAIGGIQITGGSTGQALSTTAALMTGWLSNNNFQDSGTEILPDYANNRVIVSGVGLGAVPSSGNPPTPNMRYKVSGVIEGTITAQEDIIIQLAKNGVAVAGQIQKSNWNTSIANQTTFEFYVTIASTDVPGTLALMPATSPAAPESTNPVGQFTGANAAPLVGCALTLLISSGASTPTVTPVQAVMNVQRIAN